MSRIEACFNKLQQQGKKALIPFITAGDPDMTATDALMSTIVEAGADIIELGVPFSDPMAEGPVIQRASERALQSETYMEDILAQVARFRRQDKQTPIVLMGYLNPIEYYGYERFAADAATAGVDGILTVDIPPEEAENYRHVLVTHGLDPIFLIAPTSPEKRMELISTMGSGFVYYVSLKGVTGADSLHSADVEEKIKQIRQYCHSPVAVGFGIKDADSAARIAQWADAVVVGSAIIKRIEANILNGGSRQAMLAQVGDFLRELRQAIDTKNYTAT